MVAAPKAPMRRSDPRSETTFAEIHGIAAKSSGREQSPFILWDLSDKGLCLWLPEKARTGDILKLTIAKPFVLMVHAEVRWCKEIPGDDEGPKGFKVGLRGLDNFARLETLHRELGAAQQKKRA